MDGSTPLDIHHWSFSSDLQSGSAATVFTTSFNSRYILSSCCSSWCFWSLKITHYLSIWAPSVPVSSLSFFLYFENVLLFLQLLCLKAGSLSFLPAACTTVVNVPMCHWCNLAWLSPWGMSGVVDFNPDCSCEDKARISLPSVKPQSLPWWTGCNLYIYIHIWACHFFQHLIFFFLN